MKTLLKFISVSLLLISPCLTYSQAEMKGIQVGVNGTSFVKNFLSFNDINTSGSSPFQFTFRKIYASQRALRSSLGLAISQTNQKADDDNTDLSFQKMDLSVGYEKRNQIAKKWLIYGGVDALFNYQNLVTKNHSGSFNSTDKTTSYGGGIAPVLGLQFNITERLSLSTETQLKITYTASKTTNQGGTGSSTSESKGYGISSMLPGFVYVNVLF